MACDCESRPECCPAASLFHVLDSLWGEPSLLVGAFLSCLAVFGFDALDLVKDGPIKVGWVDERDGERDGQRGKERRHAAEQAWLRRSRRRNRDFPKVVIRRAQPGRDASHHPNNGRSNRRGPRLPLPEEGEERGEDARVGHVADDVEQPGHVDAAVVEGRGEGRDEEGGADDADVRPADEFLVGGGLVDVGAVDVEGEDGRGGDHLG